MESFVAGDFPTMLGKSWGIVGESPAFSNMLDRTAILGVNVGNSSGFPNVANVGKMLLEGTWEELGGLLGIVGNYWKSWGYVGKKLLLGNLGPGDSH